MNRRLTAATIAASGIGIVIPLSGGEVVRTQPAATPNAPAAAAAHGADPLHAVLGHAAAHRAGAAHATLRGPGGARVGEVTFIADPRGGTVVAVALDLPPHMKAGNAFHGFHVHANDDPSNGEGCQPGSTPETHFAAVDGHFAETDQKHGKHRGDLPAIFLRRGGAGEAVVVTDRFSPGEVIGRAVVLHAKPDNFGNVPVGKDATDYRPRSPEARLLTHKTGNAGDRIACGVITTSSHH